jgi:hypothetical protein
MRLRLASSLLVTGSLLVVALAPLSACIRATCDAICVPSVGATAHVPVGAAALAGATVRFCRNGACGSATLGAESDAGAVTSGALSGAPFAAQVNVQDEGDGFTAVGIFVDVSGLSSLANGDVYSVSVADAHGASLLSVTRPVTYDEVQSCGPTCKEFLMDVYPTSASGITCGDKSCVSGVDMKGTATVSDTTQPVTVSLCRNGACGSGSVSLAAIAQHVGEQQVGNLQGAFATVVVFHSETSQTFSFEVDRRDDPAVLHDGDAYTLTMSQGTTTLVGFSSAAPYETTFPNGPQCDAFPCRHTSVSVP